ncbi:hypothetical protein N7523_003274 [Penicillium sp. IBT 18751x]|nr:hypothetical protein N7523_003274 [Penicillium sp. IBT 18751x]
MPYSLRNERSDDPLHEESFETAINYFRKKLISEEQSQRAQYQLYSILFNLLTISQVIIGAVITALGPSGDQHMLAITIFGALNTTIAGLLALIKGRGLPQRLRRNMSELAKVLDYIEEQKILLRHGSMALPEDGIGPLIRNVLKRYATAEDIIERNQPDTYADGDLSKASTADEEASRYHQTDNSVAKGKQRGTDEEMGTDVQQHVHGEG